MGKYIINGFVYEVICNVITVQPVQEVKIQFYSIGNQPCPVFSIKQYVIDELLNMGNDELFNASLSDETIITAKNLVSIQN
ncbi:hypothetical protein [Enterobacter hormaechei]|uniref:hypothetical protein n=1 Tax=Enterobacter hormaechei TaxID=158836 RepID=UPI00079C9A56|nr:hypothetical protein [Enterobacter hormaechei]QLT99093.1 hypothetical protein HV163_08820 [Enterobacter hormaechei]SAB96834.1 Uncharacterised protein [Enterobacter hormaechei]SAF38548.1 Uncharacterised protein [Enterobacter hormaechei]VAK54144.1 Uncharacterised protein [Enterobacter hormaechei]VAK92200.1 Uncharacterised protein [Enterobacter hormaechei]